MPLIIISVFVLYCMECGLCVVCVCSCEVFGVFLFMCSCGVMRFSGFHVVCVVFI